MSHHKKPVQPLPPRGMLFLRAGDLNDPNCMNVLNKAVSRQPFISHLEVLVSATDQITEMPTEIKQLIEEHTFSHARTNPAELLCTEFMNGYIRGIANGSLVLLSTNDSAEDILAIDGTGHLILALCKDTHSTLGIPGHFSHYGPTRDRYYIEIDLKPDYMGSGKPGFERLRDGLRKLGQMDFMASFVDSSGNPKKVDFPASASASTVLRPRITFNASKLESTSELPRFQKELSTHQFLSEKTLKRKRTDPAEKQEDTGLFIQELLEAVASVGMESSQPAKGSDLLSISIDGLLHPSLIRKLLVHLIASDTFQLISISGQTMPHSPVYRALKRENLTDREKGRVNGKEERPIDTGALDGWSVIVGDKQEGKTRFVFVDTSST